MVTDEEAIVILVESNNGCANTILLGSRYGCNDDVLACSVSTVQDDNNKDGKEQSLLG